MLPMISLTRPPSPFGIQMYASLTDPDQQVDTARAAGAEWVRWPVSWAEVEPVNTTPDHFNFTNIDSSLARACSLGMRPVITIGGNPAWAATYSNSRIDKVPLSEFAQFVGALVERYDGDGYLDAPGSPVVKVWEFYNEPDFGEILGAEAGYSYWGDFGKDYAAMLCAARTAAKNADPGAEIAIGGLAYDGFREEGGPFVRGFLDTVLENGGGQCMDLMNFHYYPNTAWRWNEYGHGLTGKANYLRDKLAAYGFPNKPFIITEAGWHSNNYVQYPSSPAEQANYVVRLFAQSFAAGSKVMIWWTWMDLPNYWGETGLLSAQGSQKPAYQVYKVAAEKLGQASFIREVPPNITGTNAAQVYEFAAKQLLYVAWVEGTPAAAITLYGSRFAVVDLQGNVQKYVSDADDGSSDGRVRIWLGTDPKYLERLN